MSDALQSLDDIATGMIQPSNEEVLPVVEEVVESDEELLPPEGEELVIESAEETTEEITEETVDDLDEETAGTPAQEEPYLDVTDEDLIEVKVDGEVVYRTIADAKKALSGEGAIEKRLKDATTARQEVDAERVTGVRALEDERNKLLSMVQQLDQHIFQPTVQMPNDAMRQQDPGMYLQALDAYNADQARISQGRNQLAKNIQQQRDEQTRNMNMLRQQNEVELVRRIPDLADPQKAPAIMKEIVNTGHSYGFSDAEIAQFFDHRSYYMAHELNTLKAELASIKRGAKVVTPTGEAKTRAPRRLRSGVTKKRLVSQQKDKARKERTDRARSSGKVDDVAQMLLKAR